MRNLISRRYRNRTYQLRACKHCDRTREICCSIKTEPSGFVDDNGNLKALRSRVGMSNVNPDWTYFPFGGRDELSQIHREQVRMSLGGEITLLTPLPITVPANPGAVQRTTVAHYQLINRTAEENPFGIENRHRRERWRLVRLIERSPFDYSDIRGSRLGDITMPRITRKWFGFREYAFHSVIWSDSIARQTDPPTCGALRFLLYRSPI